MASEPTIELERPGWTDEPPDEIGDGTILVVRARLSQWRPSWERLGEVVLSDEEKARGERFHFEEDRRRHRLGRTMTRVVLGRLADVPPAEIAFEAGPHDKPRPRDLSHSFNISHGGDVVIAAFARETKIGLDVEDADRTAGEDGLARSVLTDVEFERWTEAPESERARFFMHLWTAKESIIKATGEGLFRDPTTVECAFDGRRVSRFAELERLDTDVAYHPPDQWRVHPFEVGDDAVAAVTYRDTDGSRRTFRYTRFSRFDGP